jgi:hypothetical protein
MNRYFNMFGALFQSTQLGRPTFLYSVRTEWLHCGFTET